MNIDKEYIENKYKNLAQIAKRMMEDADDPLHDFRHILDVVDYAYKILGNLPEDCAVNPEVCILCAYWHDVGRSVQKKEHAQISANILKEKLIQEGYDNDFIESCYKAIVKHSHGNTPETFEGIVVQDADKIAYIGERRWENCIKNDINLDGVIEFLPILRNQMINLDVSKSLYDETVIRIIAMLHNRIFNK